MNDFCMKIFNEWRPASEKPLFLTSIFTFSFIYMLSYSLIKRIVFNKSTVIRGAILGVPNIFSSFFLLGALAQLPAILVYPVSNIGIILLSTVGAIFFWNERLNNFGKWALVSGLVAIILLSM